MQVIDVGGSIYIHAFGAYFGLAISRVLYKTHQTTSNKEGTTYQSDLFSMLGEWPLEFENNMYFLELCI